MKKMYQSGYSLISSHVPLKGDSMKRFAATKTSDYARLRNLTTPTGNDLAQTFHRLGGELEGAIQLEKGESAAVVFTLVGEEHRRRWSLRLQRGTCSVGESEIESPDLEIVVREEGWWDIASGRLSPMEVFGQGRLRLRGDMALAERLYAALASDDGTVAVCG